MKRRNGMTVIGLVIIFAILAIIAALLLPVIEYSANAKKEAAARKKEISLYEDKYQETLLSAVNWLLSETDGPLDPLARGVFIGSIKNGEGLTLTKNEGALSAFAVMDWPKAKEVHELCDSMKGFIGLMKTAEGHYMEFAQKQFNTKNETLRAMLPEKERKPPSPP